MNVTFRPIEDWPGELRSPARRQRSRFESGWSRTLDLLTYELGRLGASSVVVRLDLTDSDIRRDGWPRANARPGHPGVVVEWQKGGAWYGRANDLYDDWQSNIRGIALTLKALRDVERWGAVSGEQYEGMRLELEASAGEISTREQAARFLSEHGGIVVTAADTSPSAAGRAYRRAAAKLHPDAGGDPDDFKRLQRARDLLLGGGR